MLGLRLLLQKRAHRSRVFPLSAAQWESAVAAVVQRADAHSSSSPSNSAPSHTGTSCSGGAHTSAPPRRRVVEPRIRLLAVPGECNFSGVRWPVVERDGVHALGEHLTAQQRLCGCCEEQDSSVCHTLLLWDAAALVSHTPVDLSETQPHFVVMSFYKMFGFPTGIGALLIRNGTVRVCCTVLCVFACDGGTEVSGGVHHPILCRVCLWQMWNHCWRGGILAEGLWRWHCLPKLIHRCFVKGYACVCVCFVCWLVVLSYPCFHSSILPLCSSSFSVFFSPLSSCKHMLWMCVCALVRTCITMVFSLSLSLSDSSRIALKMAQSTF
jgi:Aminotransferase class-V